jgi:uncharacterized protein YqgC (DUF456 family)
VLSAALSAITFVGLVVFAVPALSLWLTGLMLPYSGGSLIVIVLTGAVLDAIAIGYTALVITKTYGDASFGGRRY